MRIPVRQEAAVTLAVVATILLAGFTSCPMTPAAQNGDGITASVRNANDVTLTTTPIWIVGNPAGTFAHVQPGVKSEIYIDFQTGAGGTDPAEMDPNSPVPVVSIGMKGPGVMGDPAETKPFEPNGSMHFVFPINRFGDYTATGDVLENGHSVFHFVVPEHVK